MKLWEYKDKDKIMEHLMDVCNIKCDKFKGMGKPHFNWIFSYDEPDTKEFKIAKRKFKALKCCNEPMFRVQSNGGIGYNGFNVTFIELLSYKGRVETLDKRNKKKMNDE